MRLEALEEERIRKAEIARLNEERLRQEQEALRLQHLEITNKILILRNDQMKLRGNHRNKRDLKWRP